MDFRSLPSVDRVLADARVKAMVEEYSHEAVVGLVRGCLEEARASMADGKPAPALDALVETIRTRAASKWQAGPTPLINATGVIIHTNLGRAPLSIEALAAVERAAKGYSNLEFDLESGERGSRQAHVEHLLCQLTGAQAAIAVNNNASAVMLGLSALAKDRDVIVSRGEAVEIGGGFRIPDVLRQSGARLVEVGTTNRTYVADYEAAIAKDTGALLRVHSSNFKVMGFTHSPEMAEMAELARKGNMPLLHDVGSGCLLDTAAFGLAHEPTPQESVAAGVDLVFFSGDKLLGGPQAGIVVGKQKYIAVLKKHPLARAVRIDKLTLAALTATLLHYIKNEATEKVPVWQMVSMPLPQIKRRAAAWARALGEVASVIDGESTIGGGSLPGETLPTKLLAIDVSSLPGGGDGLASRLRRGNPPIVARIEKDRLVLDPRTVPPQEDRAVLEGVKKALEVKG